jgi:hypothetical protein
MYIGFQMTLEKGNTQFHIDFQPTHHSGIDELTTITEYQNEIMSKLDEEKNHHFIVVADLRMEKDIIFEEVGGNLLVGASYREREYYGSFCDLGVRDLETPVQRIQDWISTRIKE